MGRQKEEREQAVGGFAFCGNFVSGRVQSMVSCRRRHEPLALLNPSFTEQYVKKKSQQALAKKKEIVNKGRVSDLLELCERLLEKDMLKSHLEK